MLIAGKGLYELVEQGVIECDKSQINAASIDLTLGDTLKAETLSSEPIDIGKKESPTFKDINISNYAYILRPGAFVLAYANEVFNLPNNISAEYVLKSSMARAGLNHLLAGFADAGWNGQLTLELSNATRYTTIKLYEGMKCGQMKFYKHEEVPDDQSYAQKGSYNDSTGIVTSTRK